MTDNHNTDATTGLDLVGCPACAAPAEIVERFVLDSTDGPIEHATVTYSGTEERFRPLDDAAAITDFSSSRSSELRGTRSSTTTAVCRRAL